MRLGRFVESEHYSFLGSSRDIEDMRRDAAFNDRENSHHNIQMLPFSFSIHVSCQFETKNEMKTCKPTRDYSLREWWRWTQQLKLTMHSTLLGMLFRLCTTFTRRDIADIKHRGLRAYRDKKTRSTGTKEKLKS